MLCYVSSGSPCSWSRGSWSASQRRPRAGPRASSTGTGGRGTEEVTGSGSTMATTLLREVSVVVTGSTEELSRPVHAQVCQFKCADKEALRDLVSVTFDKLKKNIRMGKIANKAGMLSAAPHNIFTCLSSLNYFAASHILGGGTVTGMGDFSKGPCVGVCYYIKKRGIILNERMKKRMRGRKPCIGLCHIEKMRKRRKEKMTNKENKEGN